ncbi:MAG: hypothetical protein HYS05_05470 [Acidobacteria bacterium]|nr:hypothetical protein [Acidobacteriota bacterium]
MTLADFKSTLIGSGPPDVPPPLLALWHDARGDWQKAHEVAQDVGDRSAAWVHAYLHRKEGDASNARYWYERAGQPEARDSLEAEWTRIITALLGSRPT